MERFEKLVSKEIRDLLHDDPDRQAQALKLSRKIFQWLDEGGVDRIEERLKQEVVAIERTFAEKEGQISQAVEEG